MVVTEENYLSRESLHHANEVLSIAPKSLLPKSAASPNRRAGVPTRSTPSLISHNFRSSPRLRQAVDRWGPKKIRFYRNGDRFFSGIEIILSSERVDSFENLLCLLSKLLEDTIFLTNGVRYVFTVGGNMVCSLDAVLEEQAFVCSSGESFKQMDYCSLKSRPSCHNLARENALKRRSLAEPTSRSSRDSTSRSVKASPSVGTIAPKRVSVFLNGPKPRQLMRLLLDDRSAQSFTHVLDEITKFFSPLPGPVRKVFGTRLGECSRLADFFHEDTFVASVSGKVSQGDLELDADEDKLIVRRKIMRNGAGNGLSAKNGGTYTISYRDNALASPRLLRRMTLPKSFGYGSSSFSVNHPPDIRDRYHIGKLLGNGNFATVYECIEWRTGRQAAMKIIEKNKIKDKKLIGNEIAILRRLRHPNIVNMLDEYTFEGRLYVVMELVKCGDLFTMISQEVQFSEAQTAEFVRCLCLALDYLHSNLVVHRDVKPENLLVSECVSGMRSLKLADFGLAALVKDGESLVTICGSPTYVAPEILTETGYGFKVDVWATGVTTYILLCGYPPFQSDAEDQEALFEQILSGQFEFRSPYWDHISAPARDLIRRMIEVNADSRYFANQVLDHEWMKINCRLQPIREDSTADSTSSDSGVQLVQELPLKTVERPAKTAVTFAPTVSSSKKNLKGNCGTQTGSAIPRLHKKYSSNSVCDLPMELSAGFWGHF